MKFARYADDFVICVKSTSAGYRVMDWVNCVLTTKLKLIVNEEKSRVVKTNDLHFLGFTFRGKKIRWSDKAFKDFKFNLRRLTKRSWGISMPRRYRELRVYMMKRLVRTRMLGVVGNSKVLWGLRVRDPWLPDYARLTPDCFDP